MISSFFVLEHCIPTKTEEDEEWMRLKEEFENLDKVDKKLTFLRQAHPGRKWKIVAINHTEKVHLVISE